MTCDWPALENDAPIDTQCSLWVAWVAWATPTSVKQLFMNNFFHFDYDVSLDIETSDFPAEW